MSISKRRSCLFVMKSSALNRGMNTGIENIAWGLAERGVEVHILAGGTRPTSHAYKLPTNVYYHFTNEPGDNPFSFIPFFQDIVNRHQIDVVIGWIFNIASLTSLVNTDTIHFIGCQGEMPPRSLVLRFTKHAFRQAGAIQAIKFIHNIFRFSYRCRHVVSNSQTVQNATISSYRLPREKCRVILGGIDINIYRFEPKQNNTSEFNILFAGNIVKQKGIDDLINALKHINTPMTITFCGRGKQSYIDRLEHKVTHFNLGHVINYVGVQNQSDLIKYYNNCDIFVFPSYSEGMPKALLEAMSCGCPVICSNIQPHREIISQNINGLMTPVKSPTHLAESILMLYDNPELRKSMAQNARVTIENNFSNKREIDEWFNLLHELP